MHCKFSQSESLSPIKVTLCQFNELHDVENHWLMDLIPRSTPRFPLEIPQISHWLQDILSHCDTGISPNSLIPILNYYFYERLKDDVQQDGSDFDLLFNETFNASILYDINDIVEATYINNYRLKTNLIWTPSYHYKVHFEMSKVEEKGLGGFLLHLLMT